MTDVPSSHTFAAGVATTSEMNAYVRDPISFLLKPPIARLRQIVAQSIPSTTFTPLTFTAEDVDTDVAGNSGHSNSSLTSRWVCTYPGWYELSGGAAFAANAAGRRLVIWTVNGSNVDGSQTVLAATAANDIAVPARTIQKYLSAGDYVELSVYQESGGALLTYVVGIGQSTMEIRWVSI